MEVLGIGPMELILILIVALMVFGPDKLPQIGAKLGRAMRDMRRATRAISEEINSTRAAIEAPAKELAEPFRDVTDAAKAAGAIAAAARNPGQALRDSVMRELNAPSQPENSEQAPVEGENIIAPPRPVDTLAPAEPTPAPSDLEEPAAALPEPEEPLPALPPPDAKVAEPPAPDEAVAALPPPDEKLPPPDIDASTENDEENRPSASPDPRATTPPEQ